jgi:hypothetical protein
MSPLAARALIGVPAGELASLDVRAEALLGPRATEVYDQAHLIRDWQQFTAWRRPSGSLTSSGISKSCRASIQHA